MTNIKIEKRAKCVRGYRPWLYWAVMDGNTILHRGDSLKEAQGAARSYTRAKVPVKIKTHVTLSDVKNWKPATFYN